jgi:hypothetical protein
LSNPWAAPQLARRVPEVSGGEAATFCALGPAQPGWSFVTASPCRTKVKEGLAVAAAEQEDEPFQVLAQLGDAVGGGGRRSFLIAPHNSLRRPAPCPAAASRGPPGGMTAARRLPAPELPVGPAATHKPHTFPCFPPPDYRIAARSVKDAFGTGSAGQATPGP